MHLEAERERIYREVHDDKSRLLDAALADIELYKRNIEVLKERIALMERAAKRDRREVYEKVFGDVEEIIRSMLDELEYMFPKEKENA